MIARYTIAVSRRFKRENEPDVDFINCVSFGKPAELIEKYFKKGSKIAVTGRLQIRTYDDAQGVRRWMTEVITDDIEFVESKAAFEARMNASHDSGYGGGNYNTGGYGTYNPGRNELPEEPKAVSGIEPIGVPAIDDDDLPF